MIYNTFRFTIAIPILVLAALYVRNYTRKRRDNPAGLPLPPGPPRLPIIGNLFGIKDLGASWLTFAEWSKKYGDLLYLEILGQKVLIINSEKVAEDLLHLQNYSDRPHVPMIHLMGWQFNIAFVPYGPLWRKHRKVIHHALSPTAMISYRPVQLAKVRELAKNFLQTPQEMEVHLSTFNVSVIMEVVYGYKIAPKDDVFVSIGHRAVDMITNSFFPGAALVNTFPVLQHLPDWFPGTGFKRYARECSKLTRQMLDLPYDFVRKQMAEGIAPHSMVSKLIENKEEEAVIKSVAGTTYSGAAESSTSALWAFMMAMVIFPDVQKKAQAEIDRVTGGTRMPDYSDRPSLVYLEATYREMLRWSQVTPLGAPRKASSHDVYNGYFIPKDAIIFMNIWSMTHNEDKYPDPNRFMPERFLDAKGQLTEDLGEQHFGFGRRICVGKFLAEESIWIAMASILAVFDVNKAKDEHGREIDVVPEYTPGVIIHPKSFPLSITARSARAVRLIQQTEEDE